MNKFSLLLLILLAAALTAPSCTTGLASLQVDNGLPEEVFTQQEMDEHAQARVGVFPFSDPSYARGTGQTAARILHRQLEKSSVFGQVLLEGASQPAAILHAAHERGCDLIITGDILYWFDGSTLEPSRVEQEIQVVSLSGGEPRTLWRVRLAETGWPKAPRDYILGITHAAPAPSASALLQKNAQKFCRMIATGRIPETPGSGEGADL